MSQTMVVSEQEAYQLLGHLIASADTTSNEAHLYCPLRFIDAARMLLGYMLAHGGQDQAWLDDFKRELDQKATWVTRDPDGTRAFLDEASRSITVQLKQRLTDNAGSTPAQSVR